MEKRSFTAADLEALRQWDTPTICNGLELIAPERRAIGFTVEQVAADRRAPPIVGLARTGLIRAKEPPRGPIPSREDWYDDVAAEDLPTIAVLQDIDGRPGHGAFWGEVQSTCIWRSGCRVRVTTVRSATSTCSPRLSDRRRTDRSEPCACASGANALRGEYLRHAGVAQRRHSRRLPRRRGHSRQRSETAAGRDRPRRAAGESDP